MLTRKQILKAVGNEFLQLHKGNGYFYFVYDDGKTFKSEMVFVMLLNDLSLDRWISEAKAVLPSDE